jgi:serine/threonine-protein kinase
MRALLSEPIPDVRSLRPDCPATLDAVVQRALEREVDDRYASAQETREAIRGAVPPASRAPDAVLAELMRTLFSDRMTEKEHVLRELRDRRAIAVVPAPEVDEHVELLSIAGPTEVTPTITGGRKRARGRGSWALAAIAAVAVVAGVAYGVLAFGESEDATAAGVVHASEIRAPAREPTEEPVAEPPSPAVVRMGVSSSPEAAEVRVGDDVIGLSPVVLTLPRADAPVRVSLALDGYAPAERWVVPDASRELHVVLSRAPEPRAPRGASMRRSMAADDMGGAMESGMSEPQEDFHLFQ